MPVRWSEFCIGERQHSWFRCRSLWICWLGCNFHSKASLAVCANLNSWFTDYPGILIPKRWVNPCSRRCRSYQSQELQILESFLIYSHRIRTLRKSQQQGLDFRNLHVNMNLFHSMVLISWLVKAKNGKNIEKYVHPLSLMCVSLLFYWFFDEDFNFR